MKKNYTGIYIQKAIVIGFFFPDENLCQERPAEKLNMQKCPSLSGFYNPNQALLSLSQQEISGINPVACTAAFGIAAGAHTKV